MKYTVTIPFVAIYTAEVEADSADEAIEKVDTDNMVFATAAGGIEGVAHGSRLGHSGRDGIIWADVSAEEA